MIAHRVRSLVLLVFFMLAAVPVTLTVSSPVDAATTKSSAVKKTVKTKTVKQARTVRAACGPTRLSAIKAAATKKATKTASRKRLSKARRRALRASLIVQGVRAAGCKVTKVGVTTTSTTRRPAGSGAKPSTVAPSTPAPLPTPDSDQSWWTGIQGGANTWDARVGAKLGAKIVRVEFEVGTPIDEMRSFVADYADRGIRILPLAGFHGRIPSSGEAQNVATWAREFGPNGAFWQSRPAQASLAIRHIEFGNETSFSYQGTQSSGGDYARRAREASQAIAAANSGVGLLVQADGANQSDRWVDQMYAAVPNIHEYAAGWTVHPYGPRSKWQTRVDELIADTAAHGAPSTMPIDITEWGLSTDNGRCLDDNYGWNPCMTYDQAADAMTSTVAEMRARYGGRIRHFLVYNGRDLRGSSETGDREHYFGLTTVNEADKGAFTNAARALMAMV